MIAIIGAVISAVLVLYVSVFDEVFEFHAISSNVPDHTDTVTVPVEVVGVITKEYPVELVCEKPLAVAFTREISAIVNQLTTSDVVMFT